MRLIDAEALEESIEQIDWYHLARNGEMVKGATSENGWYKEQDIYNAIEEAPIIEAKPVTHAHWVTEQEAEEINRYDLTYCCSACGHCDWDCTESEGFEYCPNCGAKMDEKENT